MTTSLAMHGLRALVGGAALARAQIWSRHLAPLHTSASSAAGRPDDDGGDDPDSHMMIPWVRTVISGVGIMRHPKYNKGARLAAPRAHRLRCCLC